MGVCQNNGVTGFRPSQTTMQTSSTPRLRISGQHLPPVLGALTADADRQPEDVAFAVNSDTDRCVDGPVGDLGALAPILVADQWTGSDKIRWTDG